QTEILSPNNRTRLQRKICSASRKRLKRELTFDAGERRTKAKMTCPAKRQVAIVGARKVEPIRIGKAFRITIAGAHHRDNCLAFANLLATEFGVLRTNASCVLTRTLVTQKLFDRRGNQR